jgi:integrase
MWVAADHPWKPSTLVGCRSVARALGRDAIATERVAALSPRLLRETMGRWRGGRERGGGRRPIPGVARRAGVGMGGAAGRRASDPGDARPARPEPRRPLADEQVRALFQAAEALLLEAVANDTGAGVSARRARRAEQALLLVRLAADTGARRGELAGLRVGRLVRAGADDQPRVLGRRC